MVCQNEEYVHKVLVELGYAKKGESETLRQEANYGPDGTLTFQLIWSHLPASGNREYLTHRICFRDTEGKGTYALESHDVRISKKVPGPVDETIAVDLTFRAGTGNVPDLKGAFVRARKRLQEVINERHPANRKSRKKTMGKR